MKILGYIVGAGAALLLIYLVYWWLFITAMAFFYPPWAQIGYWTFTATGICLTGFSLMLFPRTKF